MALIRVSNLAGIPLFYDRYNNTSYGVSAVPMRPYIDEAFHELCETCFGELNTFLGRYSKGIVQIWSGGVGRQGTGTSYHHSNRAFDLDALIMNDGDRWIATSFPQRPHIYLAIESYLRMQFGTVLNYQYNAAHEDHFHFDNGTNPSFNKHAKSRVTYLQNALKFGFGGVLGVDGVWGPETARQQRLVFDDLGIGSIYTLNNWHEFLQIAATELMTAELGIVTS